MARRKPIPPPPATGLRPQLYAGFVFLVAGVLLLLATLLLALGREPMALVLGGFSAFMLAVGAMAWAMYLATPWRGFVAVAGFGVLGGWFALVGVTALLAPEDFVSVWGRGPHTAKEVPWWSAFMFVCAAITLWVPIDRCRVLVAYGKFRRDGRPLSDDQVAWLRHFYPDGIPGIPDVDASGGG